MSDLEDFVEPHDARDHRLVVRPCPLDVAAWADGDKVTQILVNLISNAIKHTPKGTSIEVFCPHEGQSAGRLTIAVRDDGPGIAPDKHAEIFEPFVQVGRSLNHPVDGLGLGLAIARDLARAMGGDLAVSSALGQGTTFALLLPRA
jgi:signal transduction histidine kinase